jgi:hypothetical protein
MTLPRGVGIWRRGPRVGSAGAATIFAGVSVRIQLHERRRAIGKHDRLAVRIMAGDDSSHGSWHCSLLF